MAITTANNFWLSLSKRQILDDVGFTVLKNLPEICVIKSDALLSNTVGYTHPILPKFQDYYLMVGIVQLCGYDSAHNELFCDKLRRGVQSEYVNYYYDSDKYNLNLITSKHSSLDDENQVSSFVTLFATKKLYKIIDVYITDIVKNPNGDWYDYNIKIKYLEEKK